MSDVSVLVRAGVGHSLRRQRALALLMVLFVAALLICNAVVGAGISRYARSVQSTSALNLIEVSAATASATRPIDDAALTEIRGVAGVTAVFPWIQIDLALSDAADWPDPSDNPGSLWATPLVPGLLGPIVAGAVPAAGLADDEIVLPRTVPGGSLDGLLGHTVQMEYTRVVSAGQGEPTRRSFRVVAIVDNAVPDKAGPTPSYVSEAALLAMIRDSGASGGAAMTYPSAYVQAASPETVPQVQAALSAQGFAVSSLAAQVTSLGGLFDVLSSAGWLFAALLVLVCLGVGSAIGSTWVRHRTREIGLLKAIGWARGRITAALTAELAVVGLAVAAVGLVVGIVGSLVATAVIADQDIELLPIDAWQTPSIGVLLLTLVLVPVCVCLGGLWSVVRAAGVDADDALRDL